MHNSKTSEKLFGNSKPQFPYLPNGNHSTHGIIVKSVNMNLMWAAHNMSSLNVGDSCDHKIIIITLIMID